MYNKGNKICFKETNLFSTENQTDKKLHIAKIIFAKLMARLQKERKCPCHFQPS